VQNGPENIVARIELVEASENKTASKVVQPNEKEEVKTAFEAVHENNDGQSSEEEEEEEEAV
jgi:hypothetical protein